MTWYALILFSHVAGALFLFAGLILEWIALDNLRRSLDLSQAESWIRQASIAARCYGPAIGVVLLSGGYLASKIGGNQGWILVSFITLLVIGLIGAIFTRPRVRGIQKASKDNVDGISTALQNRLQDPALVVSVRFRAALMLAVVLLMVSKLDVMPSLVTIGVATFVGIIAALPAWRRPRLQRAGTVD